MEDTMTTDHTHVRVRRDLWEAIQKVAEDRGMSGASMMKELMEGGSTPGYMLAEKLKDLQAYCSANEKALVKFFEYDDEDNYGWLKDYTSRTLSEIEHTESGDDQDDQDDQADEYEDDDDDD